VGVFRARQRTFQIAAGQISRDRAANRQAVLSFRMKNHERFYQFFSDPPKRFFNWNSFYLALAKILQPAFQFRHDRFVDQPVVFFVDSEQKAFSKNNSLVCRQTERFFREFFQTLGHTFLLSHHRALLKTPPACSRLPRFRLEKPATSRYHCSAGTTSSRHNKRPLVIPSEVEESLVVSKHDERADC
jgi:hypothetical protein